MWRRDKYEAKTLYWAEKTIKGVHRFLGWILQEFDQFVSLSPNKTAIDRSCKEENVYTNEQIKGNLSPAGVVELAPQGGHGAAGKDASVPKGGGKIDGSGGEGRHTFWGHTN